MLDKMKQFKWLIIVSFILLVIPLYLTFKNSQESSTLKTAFEKQDRIEALHYLMRSEKYASQIREAGGIIPSDGAIRLDGVIYPLEKEGEVHLKISPPQKDAKDFQLFFVTQVDDKQTYVAFVLDKDLNLVYSNYSQDNDSGKREGVSISQSEEERLLKIVRGEIDDFMENMYRILYA